MIMNDLATAMLGWQRMQAEGKLTVLSADQAQQAYGADTTGARRTLAGALQLAAASVEELPVRLQEVMRIAQAAEVPVYPISTGHNWGYGTSLPARDGCMILDLSRLQAISLDAEMGVVTLQPGVTQGMLADFLEQGGHGFMVPVTGGGPTCSLLGNALERGYGVTPHTDHFSAVSDLEAVLADGSLYRTALREAGGEELARLFKWGIGTYSTGLFTQSGFGIVTRMSIILAPRPECIKVCLFSLKDDALLGAAVERIRSIIGKLPGTVGGINLMNQHRVLAMSAPYPADRLGPDGLIARDAIAELGRQYQILPWTGFGTLYGSKRMVAAAQKEIRALLRGVASRLLFLSPSNARQLAAAAKLIPGGAGRRLAGTAATLAQALDLATGRPNETALPLAYWRNPAAPKGEWRDPARDGCGLTWYAPLVPMRARDAQAYVAMVTEVTRKHGMEPLLTFTSLSDRLFDSTVPLIFERDKPASVQAAQACYAELLEVGRAKGWFPYRVGINTMPTLRALESDSARFHDKLQNAIDPLGLIAPGRYR